MWNLFKSTLRSFKRNKASIIGLSFLTFVSVGVFTCLNSTTSAMTNEYNYISNQGNLHDFTVSELYNTGICKWTNDVATQSYVDDDKATHEVNSPLYNANHLVMSTESDSSHVLEPYVTGEQVTDTLGNVTGYDFTVYYTVDLANISSDTTLYRFYVNALTNADIMAKYQEYVCPVITEQVAVSTDATNLYDYITNTTNGQEPYGVDNPTNYTNQTSSYIENLIERGLDSATISSQLTQDSSELLDVLSTNDTLMDQFLTNKESEGQEGVGDYVTYRNFNSVNIDNAGDGYYYKAVTSNPSDTIDKMVLIDSANTTNGTQWNNFDPSDCTYDVLDPTADDNYTIGDTLKYLPTNIDDNYDIHYIEKIFLLAKCDWGSTQSTSDVWNSYIYPMTNGRTCPKDETSRTSFWYEFKDNGKLSDLLSYENSNNEQVYIKDHRTTVQWTSSAGAPGAAQITNWTSFFGVMNPEYVQKHNLHTMTSDMYDQETSYRQYVIDHPDITNQKQLLIGWLNSLKYPDAQDWFNQVAANPNFSKEIVSPANATPYIIVGSGITPDFIYPIVSIDRSTPNPEEESIMFLNNAGYSRIYDSYRSDTTENYLVGSYVDGISSNKKQEVLDQINDFAAENMIYPQGVKAAYLANDTHDTLNAAAYRIAYIPKFIDDINVVALTLTIFILLISVIICGIVIHRYIANNQNTYGIMQANGYSWGKIATSILPFAIIPGFIGTLLGALIGMALQVPLLGVFKSFWMLPTTAIGFNVISFFIYLAIVTALFGGIIYFTAFHILSKKTVDVMKADSQENPNMVSKAAKVPVKHFGIVTRYRVAVAFQSLWKLLVLVVMTALTLSSLVFSTSINGKFESAVNATTASRNYSYAIELTTPTTAGGQYKPIQFDASDEGVFGGAGLTGYYTAGNDDRDIDYYQSLYFGQKDQAIQFTLPIIGTILTVNLPGITYDDSKMPTLDSDTTWETIAPEWWQRRTDQSDYKTYQLSDALNHNYYYSSFLMDYVNTFSGDPSDYMESFLDAETYTGSINSNLFVPYMGDTVGEQKDIFYLKNRIMTSNSVNHIVGVPFAGILSNPWDIAASLEPDATRTMAIAHSADFINYLGKALYTGETSTDPDIKALYDRLKNGAHFSDYTNYITDNGDRTYSINESNVLHSLFAVALVPGFQELLTIGYTYAPAAMKEFFITYDGVPLRNDDETYTYVDATVQKSSHSNVKLMGIKCTPGTDNSEEHYTKFINLTDSYHNNLLPLIHYTYSDLENNHPYPIVINQYTAHKYGLNIGNSISFKINNRTDRYEQQIAKKYGSTNNTYFQDDIQSFKVVGICDTYEGEEYFIDQDVANYLLGLKSHLLDTNTNQQILNQPHDYYGFEDASLGLDGDSGFDITSEGYDDTSSGLIDLRSFNGVGNNNLTPYGFNGVFTKHSSDSPILQGSLNLYSPTGLYLGNDLLTSDTARSVLQFGANTMMAAQVLLTANHGIKLDPKLYYDISQAYKTWQAAIDDQSATSEQRKEAQEALAAYADDLLDVIEEFYGNQDYATIITGANDRDASALVYSNMSQIVDTLTDVSMAVIIIMTTIIVALITVMIVNDSKKLAGLLKALGYTDKENALTYMAIYVPVILFGLLFAALLTWGLVSAYNSIIFNGIGIWLNAHIRWYYYAAGLGFVFVIFLVAGLWSIYSLKKERLIETIKNN